MKGLLLLIAVGGLLVVGWMNRDRFIAPRNDSQGTPEEESFSLKLPSPAALLGNAPPATPHPAREAQAQATAIYPGIARANSPLNQKFVALYKEAQISNPALLANPDWPLELAERAVVASGGAPLSRTIPSKANGSVARPAKAGKNVVIYTTAHCPYCTKAKQYMAKKGVSYREVNIESSISGKQEYQKLNGSGVPLITVDGETIRGFNEAALDRLL